MGTETDNQGGSDSGDPQDDSSHRKPLASEARAHGLGCRVSDPKERDGLRDALEPPPATWHESEVEGCPNKVAHGLRDEHIARLGYRAHAGCDVHREADDALLPVLRLAGVDADPHRNRMRAG